MILVSRDPLELKDRKVLKDPQDLLGNQEMQDLLDQQDRKVTKDLQEMPGHQDQQVNLGQLDLQVRKEILVHRGLLVLREIRALQVSQGQLDLLALRVHLDNKDHQVKLEQAVRMDLLEMSDPQDQLDQMDSLDQLGKQELMVVLAVLDQGATPDQQVLLEILVNRVQQDPQDLKDQKEMLGQKEVLEILDHRANKVQLGLLVIRVCQVRSAVQELKVQLVLLETLAQQDLAGHLGQVDQQDHKGLQVKEDLLGQLDLLGLVVKLVL